MAAILAWFGTNDSNLKFKLLYERALDNLQFCQYMYFPIAVIRLSERKFLEKNCKFETLYFGKSMCDKSGFLRNNKPQAIFCNA